MKKLQIYSILILFGFSFILLNACKKDEQNTDSIVGVLELAGQFEQPVTMQETLATSTSEKEENGMQWTCETTDYSIQDGAGGNEGFPLFSPNASVIYPGSLLQGNSLNDATPKIIAVDRAGGSFSTDVVDGNLQPSFTVNSVIKSEVVIAVNNIIAGSTGIVPANFSLKVSNVQSREQFAMDLGVDIDTKFTEIESKLSFSTDKEYRRFSVKLNQSFYTMSFDIPTSLDQIFAPTVTAEDLSRYVGPGNPVCYISDVTYGRIYYMLFESTSTITEMDASINASFNGITNKVDGEVEVDYLSQLSDLKIQVFAYGGESSSSLLTINASNLNDLSALLAESSVIESGRPISYVVRNVYDNQIVSTQLATNYSVTNCEPSGADGAPAFTEHWTGNVVSSMGPIGAAYNVDDYFILINKAGDQYLKSTVGNLEGPYPIENLGVEGELVFEDGVGAACNIDGNQNGEQYIMFFDKSGTQYTYLNGNNKWSSQAHQVTNIADGSCPFNLNGVGALAFFWVSSEGPSSRIFFNQDGDMYSIYVNNPNSFGSPGHIDNLGVTDCPFEAIGAAIGFYLGDDIYFIFFDEAGINYTVHGNINGDGYAYLGPFSL
jgi:thiol-activated cytolysin